MDNNKLTPQHYCNMIVEYINMRYGYFTKSKYKQFTADDIYEYCLSNTEVLDKNDDVRIKDLVRNTLATLTRASYLSLYGPIYRIEKPITDKSFITIFDEPPKMKNYTLEQLQSLNSLNVSLSNDPMSMFAPQEDEDILSK